MAFTRRTLLKGMAAGGAVAAASAVAPDASASGNRPALGSDDVGMLYDSTKCIGCRACVTKCKEVNGTAYDRSDGIYDAPVALSGTTKNIIQVAKVGKDDWSFVKYQCMHCVDASCVSVCMAGALHKEAGGIIGYDSSTCVGCRYCQVACAFDVPKFEWDKALPAIVKCEMCRHRADPKAAGALAVANPGCCEVCPREAVIYGKREELVQLARARLARDPDKYNPEIYGLKEGGGTHVLYLTAKGTAFEQLGLPKLPDEPLPAMGENIQHTTYKWFAAPAVLYGALAYAIVKNKKKQASHGEENVSDIRGAGK